MCIVEQLTAANQNFKTCVRCGQKFTGYGNECGVVACAPPIMIKDFHEGLYSVRKPIPVTIKPV